MGGAGFFAGMTGPSQTPVISRLGAGADAFFGAAGTPVRWPRCCASAGRARVQAMSKAETPAKHFFIPDSLLPERFAIIQRFAVSFGYPKQTSERGAVSCRVHIDLYDLARDQRIPVPADP